MKHIQLLSNCTLCPRKCGVNRLAGEKGYCGMGAELRLARAALHFWEEPCISCKRGSGTVFFSGCNLKCLFCQNRPISQEGRGLEADAERLCDIFLSLQKQGAENINLVTATHYVPYLLEAIPLAKEKGLGIPIVYNCGGYESVETLRLLEGLIDIYLPDFKYIDPQIARAYSGASDYPAVAQKAVREMVRQVGSPILDPTGKMLRGVIVRHLVLPGREEDAATLAEDLFALYGNRIYISMMNQYTPPSDRALPAPLNRPLSEEEYCKVTSRMEAIGVARAYLQEGGTVSESFIPSFNGEGVL